MKSVTQWTELWQWRMGPGAPNGSVPGCRERHCVHVEIAENSYGRLDEIRTPMFQSEYQRAPRKLPGGTVRPFRGRIDR